MSIERRLDTAENFGADDMDLADRCEFFGSWYILRQRSQWKLDLHSHTTIESQPAFFYTFPIDSLVITHE